MQAKIVSIHMAGKDGGDLQTLGQVELVAGKGIVGDRHYSNQANKPEQELTLVEMEQIVSFNTEMGLNIGPFETRRNIVTQGVSLNDLVGIEFMLGRVKVKGIELCEPCKHLGELLTAKYSTTSVPKILAGLKHRAGLRACIIEGGMLKAGDTIQIRPAA